MTLPKSLTTVTTFSKLLALILFVLFPFAGFFAGLSYQAKIDTTKFSTLPKVIRVYPTPLIPSSWVLYTNNNFHLSIQYPADWDAPSEDTLENNTQWLTFLKKNIPDNQANEKEYDEQNKFFIRIVKSTADKTLAQIEAEFDQFNSWPTARDNYRRSRLTVDGNPAVELFNQGTSGNTDTVYVIRGGTEYAIALYHETFEASTSTSAVFNHMVSSIKFLK